MAVEEEEEEEEERIDRGRGRDQEAMLKKTGENINTMVLASDVVEGGEVGGKAKWEERNNEARHYDSGVLNGRDRGRWSLVRTVT